MSTAWWLNVTGLCLVTLGAALMYVFPTRSPRFNEKGEQFVELLGNPSVQRMRVWKSQRFLSRLAPALLLVGFLFQLAAALTPPG
ncbi:MAG: hypothetical protein WCA45_04155 [Thiobacillaceae bacterium]